MTYLEFKAEHDAVSAWTHDERNALADARAHRDHAYAAWQAAFTMKGSSRREGEIRSTRQDYERANRACAVVEERVTAARESRRRAVKAAWQAQADAKTLRRVDRESARPLRDRVIA